MTELGEFVKHEEELKALDVQVLGISTDPVDKAREVHTQLKALFPILSDEHLEAMESYGTRNPSQEPDEHPIHVPTLVLIDRNGIIRWIHQAEDYRVRAPVARVLEQARKLR
jgi:peroxiredoxin